MLIKFVKMHGLGNDFVMIDAVRQQISVSSEHIRRIASRHHGIGCDQVLLVERSSQTGIDFCYRIFNADGGEVAQCGNGARCFAHFVRDEGLTDQRTMTVKTATGTLALHIESDGQVRVDMGIPRFEPEALPFRVTGEALRYPLQIDNENLTIGAVSIGNPHAVLQVEDIEHAPVTKLGPLIERHPHFPEYVNAGFMQVLATDHIRLRVYERGAGETLACGSGACAAVVIGHRWGILGNTVRVDLPGGTLLIQWQGEGEPVWMTGPAERVFTGTIEL